MNWSDVFDGFEFQDNKIIYENVRAKPFIKDDAILSKWYGNLAFTYQTIFTKEVS